MFGVAAGGEFGYPGVAGAFGRGGGEGFYVSGGGAGGCGAGEVGVAAAELVGISSAVVEEKEDRKSLNPSRTQYMVYTDRVISNHNTRPPDHLTQLQKERKQYSYIFIRRRQCRRRRRRSIWRRACLLRIQLLPQSVQLCLQLLVALLQGFRATLIAASFVDAGVRASVCFTGAALGAAAVTLAGVVD